MQKIPAILKVRYKENEVSPKAGIVEVRKSYKSKICALLMPVQLKGDIYNDVDNDTCGQEDNIHFNTI